jgi:23S rRNA G2445 N2-methylase RlmL
MAVKRTDLELRKAIGSASFTPGTRDVASLLDLLQEREAEPAEAALRALTRVPDAAVRAAQARFAEARSPERARLCDLVGRIAQAAPTIELRAWIESRLADGDAQVVRRAARALGKLGDLASESPLLGALTAGPAEPEAKAIIEALGKLGGEQSYETLAKWAAEKGELGRVVREAREKLERARVRTAQTTLDDRAKPRRAITVLLHVRAGLETLLLSELGEGLGARAAGRGRVAVELDGRLMKLWKARTFLHMGFPLPAARIENPADPDSLESAVVRSLSSDQATEIFTTFTRGPIRWRLEWADAGHRRAATVRIARAVAAARPELINDPRAAPWEAVVHERAGRVAIELWPRGLVDPRFLWRVKAIPAASHPTIAAALARVAGVRIDDVVWDPFVGAGAELVERALLGRYGEMIGTDTDPEALAAAKANLKAAKVARVQLARSDARHFSPRKPITLVITNPPMGRRVPTGGPTSELLTATLRHAAEVMAPGGRFVWMSPLPALTAECARDAGFIVRERRSVDMGGFDAELQAFALRRPPLER